MDNKLEELAKALVDLLRNDGLNTLQEVLPGIVSVGEVKYDGYDAEFEVVSIHTDERGFRTPRSFRIVIDEIEDQL